VACHHGLAGWGKRPGQSFKEQFVFDTIGKVAMDAISFRGQERGRRPNTGRVQILWREHPLANPTENLLLIRKTSDPEKNNRDETKILVCGRTNLDCGDSTAQEQWHARILTVPVRLRETEIFRKRRLFFSEEISSREAEVQPGRRTDLQTPSTQTTSRPPGPQPAPHEEETKLPPTGRRNESRCHSPSSAAAAAGGAAAPSPASLPGRRVLSAPPPPARLPAFAPPRRRMRGPPAPQEEERERQRARDRGQRSISPPVPDRSPRDATRRDATQPPAAGTLAPLCGPRLACD
jgi:hypothetical protein